MKVLSTPIEIHDEFIRLVAECTRFHVAVAWASVGFEAFDFLVAHRQKIRRMVVGTHFYQTHPRFIKEFRKHPRCRFVLKPDGVFHPKVYLFEKGEAAWECIIGSPNFTSGGMASNCEMAALITNEDNGAVEALDAVRESIQEFWNGGHRPSRQELEAYTAIWHQKRPTLKKLAGQFGNPGQDKHDLGKTPLAVPALQMTWPDYFRELERKSEEVPDHFSVKGRLQVIEAVRSLFKEHTHFADMSLDERKQVAGIVARDGINFRWFGSMKGAGVFIGVLGTNSEQLSLALDRIPGRGRVSRDDYLAYVKRFRQAFPGRGYGVATASRLLAMKRPDTFICLDSRNRRGLCKDFNITQTVGFEDYWDSIIERVQEAPWWSSPRPTNGPERAVWEARAAFLDCLYYDGRDLDGP
jgi:HKD family nuclease